MKTIKKMLCIILASVLILTCGITAAAAEAKETECNFEGVFLKKGESIKVFFEGIIKKIKQFFDKIAVLFLGNNFTGGDYTVPELDLSTLPEELKGSKYEYLYTLSTVDNSLDYMAHPDSVLLKNGNILTVYPAGHGKGAVLNKISTNGGASWDSEVKNTPASWVNSLETPTVYRLEFSDGTPDKLILISANSKWPNMETPGGFECSLSDDEGETWTEFRRFYGHDGENGVTPIVAMSSLTRLKENGEFVDKWMGLFHDSDFYNYKTILSFDEKGNMQWSVPEKYFSAYREIEKSSNMCEVEVIRSDMGQGDELCLITRSQTKKMNSLISFSNDEGKTWSTPVEAPAALNGERHKADYTPDGRLFITFRSIERGDKARCNAKDATDGKRGWISEGLVAWVGTYEDLKNGSEGQYRIKIAHIYDERQTAPEYYANADTGYCGNVVLADGTVVTCSYGKYRAEEKTANGKEYRTSICSKRINLKDTDELIAKMK
ncbi:MAG: exo-alpha-sialidase [Clostridia bacterium]|nr:exo-alpha-sialidase [Clostridia bacterium]